MDNSDDENIDAMRCLFEMNLPETIVEKQFTCSNSNVIDIQIVCSDFIDPGALQSVKFIWPASNALAMYLCQMSITGKKVLELGAGSGLVGLSIAKQNPNSHVLFTDRDAFLLEMVCKSAKLSNISNIACSSLNWGESKQAQDDFASLKLEERENIDLIVGADLCYSTDSIHMLFFTVQKLLRASNATYIQCSSFRVEESTEIIVGLCRKYEIARKVLKNTIGSEDGVIIEQFNNIQDLHN